MDKQLIYREVMRNCDTRNQVYKASLAQRKYEQRLAEKPKHKKFNNEMKQTVKELIEEDFSPEQIVGVMKKAGKSIVSHEWIYQFIWESKRQNGTLHRHLRCKGRRYRKRGNNKDNRGKIVGRVRIEKSPKEANERREFWTFKM